MRKRNDPHNPPVTHPAWCDLKNCGRGGGELHEGENHPASVRTGSLTTYLTQLFEDGSVPVVNLLAGMDSAPSEFLELTLEQAAALRDQLDQLIGEAGERTHLNDVGEAFRLGAQIYRDRYVRAAAKTDWTVNPPAAPKASDCKPGRDVVTVKL